MSLAVTLDQIKLKKEGSYFTIVAIFAALCWLFVAVTIIGLFYGLLITFVLWMANGLAIAHLRSESILVTEQQMPKLHQCYMEVVAALELKQIPPLYIVQAHGLLNAYATRWSGRHFVVVYSDMLEACGEDTAQIRFLLGHELGHVRSNHPLKKMLLLPGLLFPLIGSAYSRACEGTCDRYGAYAAGDLHAASQAMLILAGGKGAWVAMDPQAFSQQYAGERGFFVSWHELISGYPTLSQRTHNILTMDTLSQPQGARRHPLAYLFALFSVGGKHGSYGNILFTVAIVAILAGVALPAFTQVQLKGLEVKSLTQEKTLILACKMYAVEHAGNYPPSLDALFPAYLPNRSILASPLAPGDPDGYDYTPGLKDTDAPDTVIIEDRFASRKHVRIIVYVDASGRVIPTP